jgi:hypothetical protein
MTLMKVNAFRAILSVTIAIVINYFILEETSQENSNIVAFIGFTSILFPLIGVIAVNLKHKRATLFIRAFSIFALLIMTGIQFAFTVIEFDLGMYILASLSAGLLFFYASYGITRSIK